MDDEMSICPNCDSFFIPDRKGQKYCSHWCREDSKIIRDKVEEDESYD